MAIARAIVAEPALLLADEPTGNLDARSGADVLGILEKLVDGGVTVVLITHDRAVARRALRRLFIADGRLEERAPRG